MLTNADIPRFFSAMSDMPKTESVAGGGELPAEAGPDAPANALATAPKPGQPAKPIIPKVPEIGGPEGPEPTRYGDWERKGVCVDF